MSAARKVPAFEPASPLGRPFIARGLLCVTVQPHWARAISHGVRLWKAGPVRKKRIELRTWRPPAHAIGQTIALAASARCNDRDRLLEFGLDVRGPNAIGLGRVVALARLVAVRPATVDDSAASLVDCAGAIAEARTSGRTLYAWQIDEVQDLDAYADDPRLANKGVVGRMSDVNLGFLPASVLP